MTSTQKKSEDRKNEKHLEKRRVSLLLAIVMLVSMLPVPALAEGSEGENLSGTTQENTQENTSETPSSTESPTEDPTALTLGKNEVSVGTYTFTPTETGEYWFGVNAEPEISVFDGETEVTGKPVYSLTAETVYSVKVTEPDGDDGEWQLTVGRTDGLSAYTLGEEITQAGCYTVDLAAGLYFAETSENVDWYVLDREDGWEESAFAYTCCLWGKNILSVYDAEEGCSGKTTIGIAVSDEEAASFRLGYTKDATFPSLTDGTAVQSTKAKEYSYSLQEGGYYRISATFAEGDNKSCVEYISEHGTVCGSLQEQWGTSYAFRAAEEDTLYVSLCPDAGQSVSVKVEQLDPEKFTTVSLGTEIEFTEADYYYLDGLTGGLYVATVSNAEWSYEYCAEDGDTCGEYRDGGYREGFLYLYDVDVARVRICVAPCGDGASFQLEKADAMKTQPSLLGAGETGTTTERSCFRFAMEKGSDYRVTWTGGSGYYISETGTFDATSHELRGRTFHAAENGTLYVSLAAEKRGETASVTIEKLDESNLEALSLGSTVTDCANVYTVRSAKPLYVAEYAGVELCVKEQNDVLLYDEATGTDRHVRLICTGTGETAGADLMILAEKLDDVGYFQIRELADAEVEAYTPGEEKAFGAVGAYCVTPAATDVYAIAVTGGSVYVYEENGNSVGQVYADIAAAQNGVVVLKEGKSYYLQCEGTGSFCLNLASSVEFPALTLNAAREIAEQESIQICKFVAPEDGQYAVSLQNASEDWGSIHVVTLCPADAEETQSNFGISVTMEKDECLYAWIDCAGEILVTEDTRTPLDTPTELAWNQMPSYQEQDGQQVYSGTEDAAGTLMWKVGETAGERCRVLLYRVEDGKSRKVSDVEIYPDVFGKYRTIGLQYFVDESGLQSGTYYFTVQALSDEAAYRSSQIATSATWDYVRPETQLSTPTGLAWKNRVKLADGQMLLDVQCWNAVEGASRYDIQLYYAAEETAEPVECAKFTGRECKTQGGLCYYALDDLTGENGTGYYYFRVRAISEDITENVSGKWSERSGAYYYDGESQAPSVLTVGRNTVSDGTYTFTPTETGVYWFGMAGGAEISIADEEPDETWVPIYSLTEETAYSVTVTGADGEQPLTIGSTDPSALYTLGTAVTQCGCYPVELEEGGFYRISVTFGEDDSESYAVYTSECGWFGGSLSKQTGGNTVFQATEEDMLCVLFCPGEEQSASMKIEELDPENFSTISLGEKITPTEAGYYYISDLTTGFYYATAENASWQLGEDNSRYYGVQFCDLVYLDTYEADSAEILVGVTPLNGDASFKLEELSAMETPLPMLEDGVPGTTTDHQCFRFELEAGSYYRLTWSDVEEEEGVLCFTESNSVTGGSYDGEEVVFGAEEAETLYVSLIVGQAGQTASVTVQKLDGEDVEAVSLGQEVTELAKIYTFRPTGRLYVLEYAGIELSVAERYGTLFSDAASGTDRHFYLLSSYEEAEEWLFRAKALDGVENGYFALWEPEDADMASPVLGETVTYGAFDAYCYTPETTEIYALTAAGSGYVYIYNESGSCIASTGSGTKLVKLEEGKRYYLKCVETGSFCLNLASSVAYPELTFETEQAVTGDRQIYRFTAPEDGQYLVSLQNISKSWASVNILTLCTTESLSATSVSVAMEKGDCLYIWSSNTGTLLAAADEREALFTPEGLEWNQTLTEEDGELVYSQAAGMLTWKTQESSTSSRYKISLYRMDGDEGIPVSSITLTEYGGPQTYRNYQYTYLLSQKEPESGDYYFTIQALASGTTYRSSGIAKSALWHYDRPEAQLTTPTGTKWENSVCYWNAVEGVSDYEIQIQYARTETADPTLLYSTSNCRVGENGLYCYELGDVVDEYGIGYYSFRVRAVSVDYTEAISSAWSELCGPYYCDGSASGTCGELTWKLTADGVLTVSGTGAMDFDSETGVPWDAYMDSIQSVVIGDGVTSIGAAAFSGCGSLTSVTLGSSVASIGERAFYECSCLTGITLPDSVESIGNYAFAQCGELTSMTFGSGLESIGEFALAACSCLESLTIPDKTESIGMCAFYGCDGLTSVTLGSGLKSIGMAAFYDCTALESVTIGKSVESIGMGAFLSVPTVIVSEENPNFCAEDGILFNKEKTELVSYPATRSGEYEVPASVTTIGAGAFLDCTGLTGVTLPEGVTSIGENAFYGCTGLTKVTLPEGVTSIGENAFYGCTGLTKVTLPESLESIGISAFYGCDSLEDVEYGGSRTEWGEIDIGYRNNPLTNAAIRYLGTEKGTCGADEDGANLRWELDSSGVLTISGSGAMANYDYNAPWYSFGDEILSVVIESGVTSIGSDAFHRCYALTDVTISESVKSIGSLAFKNCDMLTEVTIPGSVEYIGDYAFEDCDALTKVTIPGSVEYIGSYAFENCDMLTEVTISEGVESIGIMAFEACSALASVTIPRSVTDIGFGAFENCKALSAIYVAKGNSCYFSDDGVLFGEDEDQTTLITCPGGRQGVYTVPTGVESIGQAAFSGCEGLMTVNISDDVTELAYQAFSGCTMLSSVSIGSGMERIDCTAFEGCNALTSVYVSPDNSSYSSVDGVLFDKEQTKLITCPACRQGAYVVPESVEQIENYAFRGCSALTELTIPASVTEIGDYAFQSCSNLKDVYYAGEKAEWEDIYIRYGNGYLTTATIHYNSGTCGSGLTWNLSEEGTLTISGAGAMAYYNDNCTPWKNYNDKIRSIRIDSCVVLIQYEAFADCSGLESIFVDGENEVYSSGEDGVLFSDDGTELLCYPVGKTGESYAIPENVTTIGKRAFYQCAHLTSVTVPSGVVSIGKSAFYGCSALTDIYYDGDEAAWNSISIDTENTCLTSATRHYMSGTCGADGDHLIWKIDKQGKLTVSGTGAMADYSQAGDAPWYISRNDIRSVIIDSGSSVTGIGSYAFAGCSKLSEVTLSDSVTSIGEKAFYGCGLTGVTLGEHVASIGYAAFFGLESFAVSEENRSFCAEDGILFSKDGTKLIFCPTKKSGEYTVPDTVTEIGEKAFYGCGLTGVTLGENVASIVAGALMGLDTVAVSEENQSFLAEDGALFNKAKTELVFCSPTKSGEYKIPSAVTGIDASAFYGCTKLTSVTIPSGVTSIGEAAFGSCSALTDVYYDGDEADWNSIAIGADNTYLTSAAWHSMGGSCGSSLTWRLNGSVLTISGSGAMTEYSENGAPWHIYSSDIQSVVIGDGVTSIGSRAFSGCTKLTSVTIGSDITSIGRYAFYHCESLTAVTIPEGTASIGAAAFSGCSNLESLTIPAEIQLTGTEFTDCKALADDDGFAIVNNVLFCYAGSAASVVIPDTITIIGERAFYGNSGLTTVTIPKTVTEISSYAFRNCSGLKDVYYGGDSSAWARIAIEDYNSPLFLATQHYMGGSCGDDLTWTLEDGLLTVEGSGAMEDYGSEGAPWYSCRSDIQSVVIEDGVTGIGSYAFNGCTGLTALELSDGLESIGSYAFQGCTGLTGDLVIPDSVTSLGDHAFYKCSGLNGTLTLSEKLTTIPSYAFAQCTGISGELVIPDSVTTIEYCAFCEYGDGMPNVTSIVFGENVVKIGTKNSLDYRPFGGFRGVKEVTFKGTSVPVRNPADLFYSMDALETVYVPAESYLGYVNALSAYVNNGRIVMSGHEDEEFVVEDGTLVLYQGVGGAVTIPENVTDIGASAFQNRSTVTSVTISAGVTEIGSYAFYGCKGLTEVRLPEGVTDIGSYAFYGCTGLTEISLQAGLTDIGNYAFAACAGLTGSLVIPDSVKRIGSYAFYGCYRLGELDLGEGVESIEAYAFADCTRLTGDLVIPDSVRSLGGHAFYKCSGLDGTLTLSNNLETIPFYAFADCTGISGELVIPDSVTTVSSNAFSSYSKNGMPLVTGIVLGKNVTTIESDSSIYVSPFYGFTGVTKVTFTGTSVPTMRPTELFYSMAALAEVHVPSESYEAYESALSGAIHNAEITCDYWERAVKGLAAEHCYSHTVVLSWQKHFSKNVVGYEITRDGKVIGHTTECRYVDSGLDSGEHSYTVRGYTAGNTKTSAAELTASTSGFRLGEIYTGHFNNTIAVNDGNIYISAQNHHNYVNPDGEEIQGKLYYLDGSSRILIGLSTLDDASVNTETLVYSVDWDVTDVDEEEYTVVFVLTDPDGTETELSGTVNVVKTDPAKIVNVVAVGDFTKVSLSWSKSSEWDSTIYKVFRKSESEAEYSLLATIEDRNTLTYSDTAVAKDTVYSYYVVTENSFGMCSEPSELAAGSIASDVEAPTVTKFTPESGSYLSGTETITVTAVDNLMPTRVKLSYSVDNGESWVACGEDTAAPFNFSFDTTAVEDGKLLFEAWAYDAKNNESAPMRCEYTVDNTGPEKVTGVTANAVFTSKITLAWNDVKDGDRAGFVLQRKNGDGYTTVASSVTTLGYNVTNLYPGTAYTYRVAAFDVRGNLGEYSEDFTVCTAADTTAPVVTSLVPSPGRYNNAIAFRASAGDDSGIKSIAIQISSDRVNWQEISKAVYSKYNQTATYAYTISLDSYSDGSIYIRAEAEDFAGNRSDSAAFVEYIVDKTSPDQPRDLIASGGDGWIYVSWLQGEEADLGSYQLYRATEVDGPYSLIASNLKKISYYDETAQRDTTYYYKVRVLDTTGNLSDFSEAVSARVADDDEAPKVVSITPASGTVIGPSCKTVEALVSDNNCIDSVVFEYKVNDAESYTVLEEIENVGYYYTTARAELPVSEFGDGDTVTLRVQTTDIVGLTSAYSSEYTYDVDKCAPAMSGLAVTVENDNAKITWTNPEDTDISGFKVYRADSDGSFTFLGSRAYSASNAYTFYDYLYDMGDGTYSYKVEAVDKVGNCGAALTDPVSYTRSPVEKKPPVARIDGFETMEVGVEEIFDAGYSSGDSGIVSYHWEFGDGTSSDRVKTVKKYKSVGSYTVTLTVTDADGAEATATMQVSVEERTAIGTVKVNVVDENGDSVANAPVYFDLGADAQKKVNTDEHGVASLRMGKGEHEIGVYKDGYLPAQKTVTVLPNATRIVTITVIQQEIVTGEFEVKRMTLNEIRAADIDVYSPANQNLYKVNVTIRYGGTEIPVTYIRNDSEIIDCDIGDSGGSGGIGGGGGDSGGGGGGGGRIISGLTFIPNDKNAEIIAVMDIPVEASYLKEFFDVRLHIINNAAPEYKLVDSTVHLDVPEGMTMMNGLTGDWNQSPDVSIGTIHGQETKTLAWILRGDAEGEYNLTARYEGTLAVFNEPVSATFVTEQPIKVYGLSAIKLHVEVNDEIKYNALYFNFGIENISGIDIYNPKLDFDGIVSNITASAKRNASGIEKEGGEEDFDVACKLLNVRVEYSDGTTQTIPFEWNKDGSVSIDVDTLSPGDAIYYEYVAYNAINYDDIAIFMDAATEVISGYAENVEVESVSMDLFSVEDASTKLERSLGNVTKGGSVVSAEYDVSGYTQHANFESSITGEAYAGDGLAFLYNDCFFKESATSGVNSGLALASIYLASNAYDSGTSMDALLKSMGYEHRAVYNYTDKEIANKDDYVAYTFAARDTEINGEDCTVVAVVVRGTPSTSYKEWKSDFNIGSNGVYHEGFKIAADEVMASLEQYLDDMELDPSTTKIWLTGHSRGAAVSNIIAERLTKSGTYASEENIYAYTFATPATSTTADTSLKNIYNYCNSDDIVSCVPLEEWGFKRAGSIVRFQLNNGTRTIFYNLTDVTYCGTDSLVSVLDNLYVAVPSAAKMYELGMDKVFDVVAQYMGKCLNAEDALEALLPLAKALDSGITDFKTAYHNPSQKYDCIDFIFDVAGMIMDDMSLDAIRDAHCQETYLAYMKSVCPSGNIVTSIQEANGDVIEPFTVSSANALNYILDDSNYLYINNASWLEKIAEDTGYAAFNTLRLAALDFDAIDDEEKKAIAKTFILELITDSSMGTEIDGLLDETYVDVTKDMLALLKKACSTYDTGHGTEMTAVVSGALSGTSSLNALASGLKSGGGEALRSAIIEQYAKAVGTAGEIEAFKLLVADACSDDAIASSFAGNIESACGYEKNTIDCTILKPLEILNNIENARYLNSVISLFVYSHEANLILDTIIASETPDTALSLISESMRKASFGLFAIGAEGIEVDEAVVQAAKEMKAEMNVEFDEALVALEEVSKAVTEVAAKEIAKEGIKAVLGSANIWYVLFRVAFKLVDSGLALSEHYENVDTYSIAAYLSSALMAGYYQRASAYNSPSLIATLSTEQTYSESNKELLARDALYLLKSVCNARLLGEKAYKAVADANNDTVIRADEKYDKKILDAANSKFGTSYATIEELYDYVYGNILRARDALFNVEATTEVVKPEAPEVTFNYETMMTNESFDSSYEYCLSDGEWVRCSGGPIAVSLRTTGRVLRVRVASGSETVAGEITTINIFAQREFSKVVSVKYDNGTYYFSNLVSTYDYQVCPLTCEYDTPDWNSCKTVDGSADAEVQMNEANYLAIRTCENEALRETYSKVCVLKVQKKQTLAVSVWGNGTVNGGGEYFVGDDVVLTAVPADDATFLGWYVAGEYVSKNENYILEMYNNASVTAKFAGGTVSETAGLSIELSNITDEYVEPPKVLLAKASLFGGPKLTTVANPSVQVYENSSAMILATVSTGDAGKNSIVWTSTDENVAKVDADSGAISFLEAGDATVTGTLQNGNGEALASASYDVTVKNNSITGIYIAEMPEKTLYYENEAFDQTGLKVMAKYKNGTAREVSGCTTAGYDQTAGQKTITVTYSDFTTSFPATVIHKASWAVTKKATCTEAGEEALICSICGKKLQTNELAKTEHDCRWIVTKAATATESGTKEYTCTVCHQTMDTQVIPCCEHTYEAIVTAATCTEDGYTTHTCSKCGHSYVDSETKALNHLYTETVVAASCGKRGYTLHTCQHCGNKYADAYTAALKHSYTVEVVAAACGTEGYTLHTCTHCGDTYKTDYTPALEHNYVETTCGREGYTAYKCTLCGDTFEVAEGTVKKVAYVSPVDENGSMLTAPVTKTADTCTIVTEGDLTWVAGWYMVRGNVTISHSVACSGAVNLILADGCELTVTGSDERPGICVSDDGGSLTVWGQSDGTGKLTVTGGSGAPAIGDAAGTEKNAVVTIHGGSITAIGGTDAPAIGAAKVFADVRLQLRTAEDGTVLCTGRCSGDNLADALSEQSTIYTDGQVHYLASDGSAQTRSLASVSLLKQGNTELAGGWYYLDSDISAETLTADAEAHIILTDGYCLTADIVSENICFYNQNASADGNLTIRIVGHAAVDTVRLGSGTAYWGTEGADVIRSDFMELFGLSYSEGVWTLAGNITSRAATALQFTEENARLNISGTHTLTSLGGTALRSDGTLTVSTDAESSLTVTGVTSALDGMVYANKNTTASEMGDNDTVSTTASEIRFTAKTRHIVITGSACGNAVSVARVSGGGEYLWDDSFTVSADTILGYKFEGWYMGEKAISKDREAKLPVKEYFAEGGDGEITLTARYTIVENVVFTLKLDGGECEVKVDDGEAQAYDSVKSYGGNSYITVTYTDNSQTFLYWVNASNNIVSTDRAYSFHITRNTTLRAVAQSDLAMVIFLNSSKQELFSYGLNSDDSTDAVSFPDITPSKSGYTFVRWYIRGTDTTATQESILAAVKNGKKVIYVVPEFEQNTEKYTVNVTAPAGTVSYTEGTSTVTPEGQSFEKKVQVGSTLKLTAAESYVDGSETKSFSCWKLNGTEVSYNPSYTVFSAVVTDIDLQAVYGKAVAAAPKVVITANTLTQEGTGYKANVTMQYTLPEGYTLEASGLLYSSRHTNLTVDTEDIGIHTFKGYTIYTLHLNPKKVYNVCGFITYTYEGKTFTTYTETVQTKIP